jgi:hypothetical protein
MSVGDAGCAPCGNRVGDVSNRRREALRVRMEARMEATDGNRSQQALTSGIGEVVDLQEVREAAH